MNPIDALNHYLNYNFCRCDDYDNAKNPKIKTWYIVFESRYIVL
jgi:hypothetical protein